MKARRLIVPSAGKSRAPSQLFGSQFSGPAFNLHPPERQHHAPLRRNLHGFRIRRVAQAGWRRDDQRLASRQIGNDLSITNTARRLAVDAAIGEGFTEVNRDHPSGIWRRNQLKIAKNDTAKIHKHHSRRKVSDAHRRLLEKLHRRAVSG